jgi:hypothetical protein
MSRWRAVLFVLLLAGVSAAAADDAARDDEMVCVPAADGRSWECGTRANPPPERGLADIPRSTGAAAPPPPFLAAPGAQSAASVVSAAPARPERPPRDAFAAAPERSAAPAVQPSPEPVSAPSILAQPRAARPAPAPPPMLAAPRHRLAPYAPLTSAEPTPSPPAPAQNATPSAPAAIGTVADSPPAAATAIDHAALADRVGVSNAVAATADPARAATAEVAAEPVAPVREPAPADAAIASVRSESQPQPASAPEPVRAHEQPARVTLQAAAPAPRAAPSRKLTLRDSAAFLQLDPTRFTLQLARTTSRADAQMQGAQLGLDRVDAALFALPVEVAGSTQWLLLWSDFADADSARAAWQSAPTSGARPAAYPRRIGPLQTEARR